ncbi:Ppx/GppA phosphatase family protein [Pedobacter caeni]|uniref:Exopolyphosphatase / guanosine-5'-triphosphate,3'-diphosphate pyrophosphatase n=1 Tax=Pedobacter caeni TaxID=288992 RepID=A0A1M4ZV43_9SPHI|nr:exopolyphosphatase [Pedobacter caeni]SHF21476.1 exopolyphosphatase / guanosine-5'-triphosphate,3'-diphosphate pyrophosphatase [Pedobacter caeni]
MKVAVIDLGTNTFHLIIAELSAKEPEICYKTNLPVRLGEGKINDNFIIQEAFERGLLALEKFSLIIKEHQVELVKATATSAIRSAENGINFVKAAKNYAGIDINVISGDEEAGYIFKGVRATGLINQTSLIMDIGGGSTEFIICTPEELLWKKSYNIGAARLMQAYFHSDPINEADQNAITRHLDSELSDLKEALNLYQPKHLIGSAGAFETFTGMLYPELNLKEIKHYAIDIPAYQALSATFIASSHGEREKMPGLIRLRVDMIVMASILTDYILSAGNFEQLSLSTYDLKMGVLADLQA